LYTQTELLAHTVWWLVRSHDVRDTNQWADLTTQDVARIHKKADTDSSPQAIHHTLGYTPNQAMPGGVLSGAIIPASASGTYSASDMNYVLAALRKLQGD
jgi:hypothetical protein